ncbi:hypothetical protein [Streptomyces sp. 8N706]|uniref:hypothetical protein n=1 Tax=Streptomyces sp. 8N706 TaxID=3457416 RepID=UPI003FD47EF4
MPDVLAGAAEHCAGGGEGELCRTKPLPVNSLLPADSPRLEGENLRHVRALAEVQTALLSIVVHCPTMRFVDGVHWLHAAALRAAG